MEQLQRKTVDGVKRWIAPKITGIGDGVKEGQIVVVFESDHLTAMAAKDEQARKLREALTGLICACNRAQDWDGTRIGNAIDAADEALEATK